MKIEALHVGMQVKHPKYGMGRVMSISEHTAEIEFPDERRAISPEASGIESAQAQATVGGLEIPLQQFVEEVAGTLLNQLGIEQPGAVVNQLGPRWHKGKLVMHPSDPTLTTKEVPMETFFHKIVMVRNNLRVLEQKINANDKLTDGEKVEMQQYITRSYGSLTTFNILFREKEDQFGA